MKRKNIIVFLHQICTFLRVHLPFPFVKFYHTQLSTFKRQIFTIVIICIYTLNLQFIIKIKTSFYIKR